MTAAYVEAHKAHKRAREWELSGEAFELGADEPEPVQAATEALLAGRIAVSESDVPETVTRAMNAAQAAYVAAEAASIAAEGSTLAEDDPAVIADEKAWSAFCDALDALWLAFEPTIDQEGGAR